LPLKHSLFDPSPPELPISTGLVQGEA